MAINLFLPAAFGFLVILFLGVSYAAYRFLISADVERHTEDNPLAEGLRGGAISLIGVGVLLVAVVLGVLVVSAFIEIIKSIF